LAQPQTFQIDVSQLRQDWVFNFGHSSEAAADAIVDLAARLVPRETDG
jgi:hypothetical protein